MRVWIDQDECSGVGVCVQDCPQVFVLGSDGLAYVTVGGRMYASNEHAMVDEFHVVRLLTEKNPAPRSAASKPNKVSSATMKRTMPAKLCAKPCPAASPKW